MHDRGALGFGGRCCVLLAGFSIASSTLGQSVVGVANQIGITPESLVIAEFDLPTASVIISRIDAAEDLRQGLVLQQDLADQAAATVTAVAQLLLEDETNEQLLTEHETAIQQLEAAQAQMQQLGQILFETAMDGLPAERVQQVALWRDGATYRVQPEFRVKERPAEEWKAIERALRAERRAIRLGDEEELAQEHAALLADIRSDPAVNQAAANLVANFDSMKALFDELQG